LRDLGGRYEHQTAANGFGTAQNTPRAMSANRQSITEKQILTGLDVSGRMEALRNSFVNEYGLNVMPSL